MQTSSHQQQFYKINIASRAYDKWNIYEQNTFIQSTLTGVSPSEHKLFSDDVFTYDETSAAAVTLVHSSVRSNQYLPAVLIISDNKTYGRKKENNKLLYKCVPDDSRIPAFLVPYEIKHVGFSKIFANLYVTIQFVSWSQTQTHPHGVITQTIGSVEELDNFYEYQLYCKSLNHSIQKFNKQTHASLSAFSSDNNNESIIRNVCDKYNVPDCPKTTHIFTIDPPNSTDFDDGFSIQRDTTDPEKEKCVLSIYISNVPILLDSLNLWSVFSQRISTIYLPDKKRPMLPTVLSDGLCSLQENKERVAFTMILTVLNDGTIEHVDFANYKITVTKNYAYESRELKADPHYTLLMSCARTIAQKYKYMSLLRNSHDMVAYLMILMNHQCATHMIPFNNGIFRTVTMTLTPKSSDLSETKEENAEVVLSDSKDEFLPIEVNNFIKIWKGSCGQYANIASAHSLLELDAYIHITSPIRRLVDILNMIMFQQNRKMTCLGEEASAFCASWSLKLDYINTTMRAIRKVQSDCTFLSLCSTETELLQKEYVGYCFDKICRNDGLFQYNVYLNELKLAYRITTRENMLNYEKRQYKLFMFNNEDNFKKKIRLQLLAV